MRRIGLGLLLPKYKFYHADSIMCVFLSQKGVIIQQPTQVIINIIKYCDICINASAAPIKIKRVRDAAPKEKRRERKELGCWCAPWRSSLC
jgi:hypothetical protein